MCFYWPQNLPSFRTVEVYQVTKFNFITLHGWLILTWEVSCSLNYSISKQCFNRSLHRELFSGAHWLPTYSSKWYVSTWNLYFFVFKKKKKNKTQILYGNFKQYVCYFMCKYYRVAVASLFSGCFLYKGTTNNFKNTLNIVVSPNVFFIMVLTSSFRSV